MLLGTLAALGAAAVNLLVCVLWWTDVWISVRCRPRNGIAESEMGAVSAC